MKLNWLIFLSYFILWTYPVYAATMPIDQIELGGIIDINGQQFVKIGHDPVKGSQFMAFQSVILPGFANGIDMDKFTPAMCNSAPTPADTDYFLIGNLIDSRDGKVYEIRKFADGKCWMVDNLMYGGGNGSSADYCAGKTTFRNANSAANAVATATNGLNPTDGSRNTLVGDCRDPRAAGNGTVAAPCTAGSTTCGYYYNWPAAIQNTNGWYGNSFQPTEPTTGICPQGWHIPTGNTTGEFQALHTSTGSNVVFWQNTGSWKGILSGYCNNAGGLGNQGSYGNHWSSTQSSTTYAYNLYFYSSNVFPGTFIDDKFYGFTVRCVKDTTERTMQNFTTADCESYATPTGTNYTPIGSLKDERDGKWYEIRKFADGKCWMVDNLAYGGATDACVNKTTFSGIGSTTPTDTFGVGTYGDCRNNPEVATYGYLYNWQAAMQHASAYYNTNYTGPVTNVQGICPAGWHLPSGGASGEFQDLHTAVGSPTTGFWQTTTGWKGMLAGICSNAGGLNYQGTFGSYWSGTHDGAYHAYNLNFGGSVVSPAYNYERYTGLAIRCVKN